MAFYIWNPTNRNTKHRCTSRIWHELVSKTQPHVCHSFSWFGVYAPKLCCLATIYLYVNSFRLFQILKVYLFGFPGHRLLHHCQADPIRFSIIYTSRPQHKTPNTLWVVDIISTISFNNNTCNNLNSMTLIFLTGWPWHTMPFTTTVEVEQVVVADKSQAFIVVMHLTDGEKKQTSENILNVQQTLLRRHTRNDFITQY